MLEYISEYGDVILETICTGFIFGIFLMLIKDTGVWNYIFQMISNFMYSVA